MLKKIESYPQPVTIPTYTQLPVTTPWPGWRTRHRLNFAEIKKEAANHPQPQTYIFWSKYWSIINSRTYRDRVVANGVTMFYTFWYKKATVPCKKGHPPRQLYLRMHPTIMFAFILIFGSSASTSIINDQSYTNSDMHSF